MRGPDDWKDWRRRLKGMAPFVRRREHAVLQRRHDDVIDALHGRVPLAREAAALVRKPFPAGQGGEVCILLTYTPGRDLAPHALHHVRHFLDAGVPVLLVINAAGPLEDVQVPADVLAGCAGVLVRANEGLDFGGWAHAFASSDTARWERLYLVNDSIAGPLSGASFRSLLDRVRVSGADHLGLTWNTQPVRHLQSYFLAFHRRVLASPAFRKFMHTVYSFPDKAAIVDSYEVRLTSQLAAQGFRCDSAYPEWGGGLGDSPQQLEQLPELEAIGFPYVKMSLLRRYAADPRVVRARQLGGVDGRS